MITGVHLAAPVLAPVLPGVFIALVFIRLEASGLPAELKVAFDLDDAGKRRIQRVFEAINRYMLIKSLTRLATAVLLFLWLLRWIGHDRVVGLRSAWGGTTARGRGLRVAVLAGAVLAGSAGAAADGEAVRAGADANGIASLASAVERLVERSKPAEWALRRSCLYYAFAGQHLLARQGISASVWVGAVVYDPGTAASHQIWPHAWLETATRFIDFSALPRWGTVKVIPRHLVARWPREVRPGTTRVLAVQRVEDLDLVGYLTFHRERFERMVKGNK